MKFSLGSTEPVSGQASVMIETDSQAIFCFIAENFFINYPKWATEVVELECLTGTKVFMGTKGRQVRKDNDSLTESIFEVVEYSPFSLFALKGLDAPYKQTYSIEILDTGGDTKLTFRFDLLEIEVFMRPFEKLLRVAIEEGAETAVENIKTLISTQTLTTASLV
jgi:hypothetical protein